MYFQLEKFSNFFDEALPLFKDHHKEVGDYLPNLDFDPDVKSYIKLDDAGLIRCFTIRESSKDSVIGYCILHIFNHLHFCNSKQALQDAIYIAKDHRGLGKEFIDWIDDELKSEGIDAVYHNVSINHDYSKTLCSLGYKKVETTYLRSLN